MRTKILIIVLVLLAIFGYSTGVITLYAVAHTPISFGIPAFMLSLPIVAMLAFIVWVATHKVS